MGMVQHTFYIIHSFIHKGSFKTSQNTMYCGGEPEHHIQNFTSRVYFDYMFHARVMNQTFKPCSIDLFMNDARYYKFHRRHVFYS